MLIAPAVDFTEELMWKKFSPEVKRQIETEGSWQRPSQYSEAPYAITRGLIEEGRKHLLLGGLIETGCPVRILQGVQDPDVPWQHAVELSSRLARDDVVLDLGQGWRSPPVAARGHRAADRSGGGVLDSLDMPASAITLVQRAMSLAISALKSSGVPPFGSLPSKWIFSTTAGSAISALMSALSLAVTGGGSLAGPTSPIHEVTENPGKPASAMVPTSGQRRVAVSRRWCRSHAARRT